MRDATPHQRETAPKRDSLQSDAVDLANGLHALAAADDPCAVTALKYRLNRLHILAESVAGEVRIRRRWWDQWRERLDELATRHLSELEAENKRLRAAVHAKVGSAVSLIADGRGTAYSNAMNHWNGSIEFSVDVHAGGGTSGFRWRCTAADGRVLSEDHANELGELDDRQAEFAIANLFSRLLMGGPTAWDGINDEMRARKEGDAIRR